METVLDSLTRRKPNAPKKRASTLSAADAYLRADLANKRALDQAVAQIERGETVRFDPRKPQK